MLRPLQTPPRQPQLLALQFQILALQRWQNLLLHRYCLQLQGSKTPPHHQTLLRHLSQPVRPWRRLPLPLPLHLPLQLQLQLQLCQHQPQCQSLVVLCRI